MEKIKMFALIVAIALVLSLTLTVLGIMSWRFFWVLAILAAFIAYYVIPWMRKKAESDTVK
jgi:hypothetical protein